MNSTLRMMLLQLSLAVASTTPALALRVPPFTAMEEAGCQRETGRSVDKFLNPTLRASARCYDGEGRGQGACTGVDTSTDETKARARLASGCGSVAGFWKLGVGANVDEAVTAEIDALRQVAADVADRVYGNTYGAPGVQVVERALSRCLARLGKDARTIAKRFIQENAECLDRDDRQQVADPSGLPRCDEASRQERLAQVTDRAIRHIETVCTEPQLLAATGDADAMSFVAYVGARTNEGLCHSYPYAGNTAVCPVVSPGGTGTILLRSLGGTTDIGWKARAHGGIIPESLPMEVELVNCTAAAGETTCNLYASRNGQVALVAPGGEVPNVDPPILIALVSILTTDLMGSISYDDTLQITKLKITQGQRVDLYTVNPPSNFPFCSGTGPGRCGYLFWGSERRRALHRRGGVSGGGADLDQLSALRRGAARDHQTRADDPAKCARQPGGGAPMRGWPMPLPRADASERV